MRVPAMVFGLVVCAVLQTVVPPWSPMGQAKMPFLLGLALYYALHYDRRIMLASAISAGVLQDALGMIPLGYSAFCFCLVGLITRRFRDLLFVHQGLTHILLGAVSSAFVTFMLFVLLAVEGKVSVNPSWLALKLAGGFVLGGIFVPIVVRAAYLLDRKLGNVEARMA